MSACLVLADSSLSVWTCPGVVEPMNTMRASGTEWPTWPHCGGGASNSDPIGCRGASVGGRRECLAHLEDSDRTAYLASLSPGCDVDHRGTNFSHDLLRELIAAVSDSASGRVNLRQALFDEARFEGPADFSEATFHGEAAFRRVVFNGKADFKGAQFGDIAGFRQSIFVATAQFSSVTFSKAARFGKVEFQGHAAFGACRFQSVARFESATFHDSATFTRVSFAHHATFDDTTFTRVTRFSDSEFSKNANFSRSKFLHRAVFARASFNERAEFAASEFSQPVDFSAVRYFSGASYAGVKFRGDASFAGSTFDNLTHLGPAVCSGTVNMSFAVISTPVTIELAAQSLRLRRTRFDSTATIRLRYCMVDLDGAVLSRPVSISTNEARFEISEGEVLRESFAAEVDPRTLIGSLTGVDASHLVLTDVDLATCLFSGAFNLDKLRIEGRSVFPATPFGTHRGLGKIPFRWTRRNVIVEEYYWRSSLYGQNRERGWLISSAGISRLTGPADLAATYRQLRKSFEDSRNEPGAADFYYGEMEARRKDHDNSSQSERGLLFLYWMLSGYGLRASRAIAWLFVTLCVSVLAMMVWGLPGTAPRTVTTGTYHANVISLSTVTPKIPLPDSSKRITWRRFEKSTYVVSNAAVFRSSDQKLSFWGNVIEFFCRFFGPLFLGLAVLAVRGRVKR